MFRRTFVGALLSTVVMLGTAQAGPLTGSFTIDIYQGFGGGTIGSPGVQATLGNPLIAPAFFKDQVTYTGTIDFFVPSGGTNTIGAFLASGTGTVSGLLPAVGALQLSAGGFANTTVFSFTAWTGTGLTGGNIRHDDGIGLYQNGLLVTPLAASAPTVPIDTPFTLAPGNFQLIYVSANGLPEQLNITATGTVPDGGATLSLLGCALFGLGILRRKFA